MAENEKTLAKPSPAMPAALPKTERERIELERSLKPVIAVASHLPYNVDEPFAVAEPKKLTEDEQKLEKEKAALLKLIGERLAKFDNRESNVPPSDEYWQLVAKYRSLG